MTGLDIIIPYHEQYYALRKCIGSLFSKCRNTYRNEVSFKITVVDDGSQNKPFFATLATMDANIDGIWMEKQVGFGACLNKAISMTKNPWILVLHSDCLATEISFLTKMYQILDHAIKDKIGMLSAVTNDTGLCSEIIKVKERKEELAVVEESIPLICALFPRKLFDKIGLFKEYPYGFYEDEEFFYRMKKHGWKQAYTEKAFIQHAGSLTIKNLWKKDLNIKEIMCEENRQRCLKDIS